MVIAAMKLKDKKNNNNNKKRKVGKKKMLTPLKESYDQPRQHSKEQRHYFANNGLSGQGYGISSGHVWM